MHASRIRGEDPLGLNNVHLASRVEDSKAINELRYPAIIISASGMATGGRVLHHLVQKLPDHRCTVLFVGYRMMATECAPVGISIGVLVVIPLVYLVLMYLTLTSQE